MLRILPLFLAATALLGACGGSGSTPARELGGDVLYELHGCVTCHGLEGEGNALGPELSGLSEHWKREDLARFLLDPRTVIAGSERLTALDARYPSQMRPYRNASEEERLRIADFLLSLE